MNSPDAFIFNVRNSLDDAFSFAMGESIEHTSGVEIQLREPLDFIAVTDHSEYMGVLPRLADPGSELASLPLAQKMAGRDREVASQALIDVLMSMGAGEPIERLVRPELKSSIWQDYVDVANRYYQPGTFTTLIGYEWTSAGGAENNINLHRNVIFGNGAIPDVPFSSFDSFVPEDLWAWMDRQREQGVELLAIPHNSNLSDGLMFPGQKTFSGEPLQGEYAEQRMRNEPLVEITQIKGTSETHPALSPNDEWADFEILEDLLGGTGKTGQARGSYVRDAWLTGLQLQEQRGFNPYRFGVVGASDSHNAGSQVEEDNYHGKIGTADGTPKDRRGGSLVNKYHVKYSAAGLTGAWAEDNTREALYAALERREVFATTGPRISVRFFGGWEWPDDLLLEHDWVDTAYRRGVPMGQDLPKKGEIENSPAFLVWAVKDPASAWLQRLQIVKGWVDGGEQHQQVYDVACADGLVPDPQTSRCPDSDATVSLETCDFDKHKGDGDLKAVWRDPDFDSGQRAFYYVRVLQNPTCRWSTWDSLRMNLPAADGVPRVIQERAYTSPIWYRPDA